MTAPVRSPTGAILLSGRIAMGCRALRACRSAGGSSILPRRPAGGAPGAALGTASLPTPVNHLTQDGFFCPSRRWSPDEGWVRWSWSSLAAVDFAHARRSGDWIEIGERWRGDEIRDREERQ